MLSSVKEPAFVFSETVSILIVSVLFCFPLSCTSGELVRSFLYCMLGASALSPDTEKDVF